MWRQKAQEPSYLSKLSNKQELLIDIPLPPRDQPKAPKYNTKSLVDLTLSSSHTKIQRKPTAQKIPLMASLKTSDVKIEGQRLGLDLVLVVDVSSSMLGAKIELVQETLSFVLDELSPCDRLSLVKFSDDSHILTPLMPMTPENKLKAKGVVFSRLSCCGSTNIVKGLQDAFDVLTSRKQRNDVTSLFLLSDGEDTFGNALPAFEQLLGEKDQRCAVLGMDYSLNCFGYGVDHDEKLLAALAARKQGNFYFIKELRRVDECFIDCFGRLISIFAANAEINVFLNGEAHFAKKYGPQWDKEGLAAKGRLAIRTIAAGLESNFLAEVEVPPIGPSEQVVKVAVAILTFDAEGLGHSVSNELKLLVVDGPDLGPADSRLEQELVRLQLADLALKVEQKVEGKKLLEAEQLVSEFKGCLNLNANIGKDFSEKVERVLKRDLKDAKYSKQVYAICSNQYNAPECEEFVQRNCVQKEMMAKRKK